MPAIIEQKVTGQEAFGSYRTLVRRYGAPAPGRGRAGALGAARRRDLGADPVLGVAERARRRGPLRRGGPLHRCGGPARGGDRDEPRGAAGGCAPYRGWGCGPRRRSHQRALGDPDAVSFGDYHVAKDIGWALTGSEVDDDGLAELLEPYAGHRYRVQRLLELAGRAPTPARARMAPRTHLPRRR